MDTIMIIIIIIIIIVVVVFIPEIPLTLGSPPNAPQPQLPEEKERMILL